ncbi:MAG: hypothetical protein OZSIB_2908 [Candidatus Ozemobacter sibiricus]|uniref:Uncharacterized protein n=1 Tax=Candidatus Ozemobacter sibiricus TaxID=2268124 RepID=A0A367ZR24_9BACT|nr:MAG: hypothetical protein OZSIB_2908 [Candidatus Ozemobacter sibiricus]
MRPSSLGLASPLDRHAPARPGGAAEGGPIMPCVCPEFNCYSLGRQEWSVGGL